MACVKQHGPSCAQSDVHCVCDCDLLGFTDTRESWMHGDKACRLNRWLAGWDSQAWLSQTREDCLCGSSVYMRLWELVALLCADAHHFLHSAHAPLSTILCPLLIRSTDRKLCLSHSRLNHKQKLRLSL